MEPGMKGGAGESARPTASRHPGMIVPENSTADGESSTGVYPLSSRRARKFVPALRRISAELVLPEPARSRVLLEMAADLEALYEHFRAMGLPEDEALERAGERLLASSEAIDGLVRLHTTAYQRLVSHAVSAVRSGFDLLLFVAGVLPLLVMSVFVVLEYSLALSGGPMRWTMLVLGGAVAGLATRKAHQILIIGERAPGRLNRGVPILLLLAAVTPVVGCIGFLVSIASIPNGLARGGAPLVVLAPVVEAGSVFASSILLGMAAAVVWYVIVKRVARIEKEESALLLGA